MKFLSIITPTYNRKYILNAAYNSLCKQSIKDFEWIIIDDGSTDNTKALVDKFISEKLINIKYVYVKNGGKHRALNIGFNILNSELTLILDSDDILYDNAVELIQYYWKKYKNNNSLCGMSFLRSYINSRNIIGKKFYKDELISNNIECRYNKNIYGDKCEVFKTSILKSNKFPEFNNEKFLTEAILWNRLARKYNTLYINKDIYGCEYLNDGLSHNVKKNLINSPNGSMLFYNESIDNSFIFKIRLKHSILYDVYCIFAHKNFTKIMDESKNKIPTFIFLPLSYLIKFYYDKKYKK